MIKTATSVSCASKSPLVKEIKPVKPAKADKPLKEKKITGVHAHKDRVAPAKTTLAF